MPPVMPSLLFRLAVGRIVMVVIVSGVHSMRAWAFHWLPREKFCLRLLENEPTRLTKFSDDDLV